MKEYIGWCSRSQIEKMFIRFYPEYSTEINAREFADRVISENRNASPAQIQGYFMFHKHSPTSDVIKDYRTIWNLQIVICQYII